MWGAAAKKVEEAKSFDRDNSYLRALHPSPSDASSDSSPFDERSAAARVRDVPGAAAGSADEKNGSASFDGPKFEDVWNESAADVPPDEAPPVTQAADSYSAADASSGLASRDGSARDDRATPDSRGSDLKDELMYYSGKAPLTKEELVYFNRKERASPSSSLGDRSGDSRSTKRTSNSHVSSAYSANSHIYSLPSGSTEMSAKEAEAAYDKICRRAKYETSPPSRGSTPSSHGSSTVERVMDRVMEGAPPRMPGGWASSKRAPELEPSATAVSEYTGAQTVDNEDERNEDGEENAGSVARSGLEGAEDEGDEAGAPEAEAKVDREPKEAGDAGDAENEEPALTTVVTPSAPRLSESIGQTMQEGKSNESDAWVEGDPNDAQDATQDANAGPTTAPRSGVHGSRGKLSFRKLKSKRLFGKSKKAAEKASGGKEETEEGVAAQVRVLAGGGEEEDEIELAYGAVLSPPLEANEADTDGNAKGNGVVKDDQMPRVGSVKSHQTVATENVTLETKEEEEPAVPLSNGVAVSQMLGQLFACGVPLNCDSPGNFSQPLERADDSPVLLFEDGVDEALNVEVDQGVLYIGEEFEALRQLHDELLEDEEAANEGAVVSSRRKKKGRMGLFKRKKGKAPKERTVDRPVDVSREMEKTAPLESHIGEDDGELAKAVVRQASPETGMGCAGICGDLEGQDDELDAPFL